MRRSMRAGLVAALAGESSRGRWWLTLVPTTVRATVLAAVLLVAVAGAATAQVVVKQVTSLPADAAFRAGDTVVTVHELNQRVDLLKKLYGVQPPPDPGQQDKFKRDTAKAVAVSNILDRSASAQGIVIPEKAINDQLGKLINDSYGGKREDFLRKLGENGLSERNVTDEIARQQTSTKLFEKVTADVPKANDDSARAYYTSHKNEMVSPEQRQLSNIVVKSRAEADQIVQKARTGTDFAELAKQHSLDGQTKDQGGGLGLVSADQLDPNFAKAAFAAPPNTEFGPVQTNHGWNVGHVANIQGAVPLAFDQLKENIKTKLNNDAALTRWNDWLTNELRRADVHYAPAYQPADPLAAPNQATGR